MGYRVESYSLDELHRISVPGKVTPSLFWALPIGNWRRDSLEELWQWFTQSRGICRDYGLLLVKDFTAHTNAADVNLDSVGGKLLDVLPPGSERSMSQSAFNIDSAKVLVLSGAYPQPGWGVLVEYQRRPDNFERLLERAIDSLAKNRPQIRDELRKFSESSAQFKRLTELKSKPSPPNLPLIHQQLERAEKARAMFADTNILADPKVRQRMATELRGLEAEEWVMLPNGVTRRILDKLEIYATAKAIRSLSREIFSQEVFIPLSEWQNGTASKEELFKKHADRDVKQAVLGCLRLLEKQVVPVGTDFYQWAENVEAHVSEELHSSFRELADLLREKIANRRGEYAQVENDYSKAIERWREHSRVAREEFHKIFHETTELQLSVGSEFLVALEDACAPRVWARSVPWDPARMVGWKLLNRGLEVSACDLDFASRELIGNNATVLPPVSDSTDVADGGYFTDYVHYVAFALPTIHPRVVATKFLARLLRPTQIIQLLRMERAASRESSDATQLADDLISSFGWRTLEGIRNTPLAGCLGIREDGGARLADGLNGNDLRIVIESLCKDVLDVFVGVLGYDEPGIWAAVSEREPKYDRGPGDWSDTVAHVTLGEAAFLIRALGPLAFPERRNATDTFCAELQTVSRYLNMRSHHQENEERTSEDSNAIAGSVQRLLAAAVACLGELPWHMQVSLVYGDQPRVLSGQAWSHGSACPRLLKVIVFDGQIPGREPLLWNRNKRNPVITDPKFIVRPRGNPDQ